jgi:zinc/manganese transport system substrate-binding protein
MKVTIIRRGLALLCLCIAGAANAQGKIDVVASFSILADFAQEVGKDRVAVTSLVGPDGDAHAYEPTPRDVQRVAKARLVIVNGLGLEGWLNRLLEASGSKALVIEASAGVSPLAAQEHARGSEETEDHDHRNAVDPHAFQDVRNAILYVGNITQALCKAAVSECLFFQSNANRYVERLHALDHEVRAAIETIPPGRRRVISSHDAFGYFAHAYGVRFLAPEGVSTDSEASAEDVARLIEQIRTEKASALFVENISDRRLIEQIARETGLEVSGVLFSDALSKDGRAGTFIDMIRHNVRTLADAIRGGS